MADRRGCVAKERFVARRERVVSLLNSQGSPSKERNARFGDSIDVNR